MDREVRFVVLNTPNTCEYDPPSHFNTVVDHAICSVRRLLQVLGKDPQKINASHLERLVGYEPALRSHIFMPWIFRYGAPFDWVPSFLDAMQYRLGAGMLSVFMLSTSLLMIPGDLDARAQLLRRLEDVKMDFYATLIIPDLRVACLEYLDSIRRQGLRNIYYLPPRFVRSNPSDDNSDPTQCELPRFRTQWPMTDTVLSLPTSSPPDHC